MKYNMATIKRTKDKDLKDEMYMRYFKKKFKKQKPKKPVKSMQDDWHYICTDRYGESWAEIGFFEAEGMTDEEIQEYVDGMRIEIYSPYDCTGKEFTQLLLWHRNPCGWISVVHYKSIDV